VCAPIAMLKSGRIASMLACVGRWSRSNRPAWSRGSVSAYAGAEAALLNRRKPPHCEPCSYPRLRASSRSARGGYKKGTLLRIFRYRGGKYLAKESFGCDRPRMFDGRAFRTGRPLILSAIGFREHPPTECPQKWCPASCPSTK